MIYIYIYSGSYLLKHGNWADCRFLVGSESSNNQQVILGINWQCHKITSKFLFIRLCLDTNYYYQWLPQFLMLCSTEHSLKRMTQYVTKFNYRINKNYLCWKHKFINIYLYINILKYSYMWCSAWSIHCTDGVSVKSWKTV